MQFRVQLVALAALAAGILASGCSRQPQRVRLGLLVWPPYEMFHLARDLGYYDGVAVELVDYRTPAEVLRAYQNDVVDGVAMTLDFLMQVSEREASHRAVLVIDYSNGGDCMIGRPGITSVADLRGKTVGLEMSTLGQFMLTRALESADLQIGDVELKFFDVPDHRQAYAAGEVDAVITYEPVRTELLGDGGNLLFDSAKIPDQIADILFVRESLIDTRQPTLRTVVDGYFRAFEYARSHPEDAAARCAAREGLTHEQFDRALKLVRMPDRDENRALLGGENPGLVTTAKRILDVLVRTGKVSKDLSLAELTDDRLVRPRDD